MLAGQTTARPRTIGHLLGPELMARLDRLDVLSRKVFAGKLPGERRSKRRGRSVEFADYRSYVPGDDLRHIDWNVFARLDRFFVKLFQEEEDLGVHLVLDASASMDAGGPNKLVFAQKLAMSLGYVGLVNHNRVSAAAIGVVGRTPVNMLAPMRGRRNVQRLAGFLLEQVSPPDGTVIPPGSARPAGVDFNDALRLIAQTRTGKGVLVVLSDFLVREGYTRGLNYLAGAGGGGGFDTYCVQILSPGELEPEKEGEGGVAGDLRLMDVETGHHAEVTITPGLVGRYKRRLSAYCEGLKRACAGRGITHVLVRSDADLEQLLLEYLRTRGMLG